jgi:carboxyl-terminal processing protease
MHTMKYRLLLATVLGLTFFSACKKEVEVDNSAPTNPTTPTTSTAADIIKDSTLLYTKEVYLWYKQIPTDFNARSYAGPSEIMTAIRKYSNEAPFTQPVDRWSFAMKKTEWNNVSSGISGDFGLGVFFMSESDLRVKSVEKESPAGKAGVRRGWRITKINGSSNISTANVDPVVKAVFESNSTNFTFQKPDNSTVDITLNAATYREDPIMLDSVYTVDSKKVGYLVFNSFLGDTTKIYNDFNTIFGRFASQGVSDVVIDLRYNGGGYVSVQEKLANYLAPAAANGNVMMKQEFNDKYSRWNETLMFNKVGSFNPARIFFIVSQSTASASELLINNMKPYVNTFIVGPRKTYGKPVGYFPIGVGDWNIFPVSFRSTNKNGEGAYFDGMPLNHTAADGLNKDWGDVQEASFASVISYISTGAFRTQAGSKIATYQDQPAAVRQGNGLLDEPYFKGAVDTRGLK